MIFFKYTWHVTYGMWHVTPHTWHVKYRGRWTFSQNFRSHTVWDWSCFEDIWTKGWPTDWLNDLINYKGVFRTALSTSGLLNIRLCLKELQRKKSLIQETLNLLASADISSDTNKSIFLEDHTSATKSLLDTTFACNFCMVFLAVPLGRYFKTSLFGFTLNITFRRHFWTPILDVTVGPHVWKSLLKVSFGHHFCTSLLEIMHLCWSL